MKLIMRPTEEVDQEATGTLAALMRIEAGNLTQREMAKRLHWPVSIVCHLEKGKRNWTQGKVDAWKKALAK